nr:hypothetical protein [uncultured Lichenicoccus sp.]
MTVRRVEEHILLDDVCAVEDAEILLQELQAGAALIDWSTCTHLHTSCLQVILAAGVAVSGTPLNKSLAEWIAPLLASGHPATASDPLPSPVEA